MARDDHPWRLLGRLTLLLSVLVLVAACARRDEARVTQQEDADAQRRVYLGLARPLITGDQRLAEIMPRAQARLSAFRLTSSGAEALTGPVDAENACREDILVVMSVATDDGPQAWLLDPRTLRFRRNDDSDLRLYRSVLVSQAMGLRDGKLDVFRFDFTSAGGDFVPRGCQRLTNDGGNTVPVDISSSQTVIYLHRADDGRNLLMRVSSEGVSARPLLPVQPFDVRHLRVSKEEILFAANPGGVYGSYSTTVEHPELQPWDVAASPAAGADDGAANITVAFTLTGGRFQPRVLAVPPRLGAAEIAALVEARNPSVLRRRALLAAALIEAQQLELANMPTLSLGAFYTPVVGIFTNPSAFSGDFLAQNLVRGLIGITQPLFDWDRNHALSEAGTVRATIARDALAGELNQQQAAAARTVIAYQAVRDRLACDRRLLALASESLTVLDRLRAAGQSGSELALAAEQERVARAGEVAGDEQWLLVLGDRLKAQCGLAAACRTEPGDAPAWDALPMASYPALLHTALLNHPGLSAAQAAIHEAFFNGQTGSRYRPSLSLGGQYGYTTTTSGDPVDDFVTLGLSGTLPLAWFKDRDLDREYQLRIEEVLRAAAEEAALGIRRELADAWAAYHQAHGVLASQRARQRSAQEAVRVGQLRAASIYAGTHPLTALGLLERLREAQLAQRAVVDSWREVSERYVQIAEAQGLAATLAGSTFPPAESGTQHEKVQPDPQAVPSAQPLPVATWAWDRQAVLAADGAAVLALARRLGIDRIYLYVGGDGAVLEGPEAAAIEAFIARCASSNLTVWALFGEPEWLLDGDGAKDAFDRLAAFQRRATHAFAGLKIDLEPQAQGDWLAGGDLRAGMAARYLAVIASARQQLHLPLWVDCPIQFFRPDQRELLAALAQQVDGATAMCYSSDSDRVVALATTACTAWPKALELGFELGRGSPPAETLAGSTASSLDALRQRLTALAASHPLVRGLAIHDLAALTASALGDQP